jgi:SAM-dependent MidA family methyltransferase
MGAAGRIAATMTGGLAQTNSQIVGSPLAARIAQGIRTDGGWWPFDRFMAAALYTPDLGYYSGGARILGHGPADGSDFVTAPELSRFFGLTLAGQIGQALAATGTDEILELGAGTGALAEQVLDGLTALGQAPRRYAILDLSGSLRERQRERLARFGDRVLWLETWPEAVEGVVLGNEVLDAMPVQLLHWDGRAWFERGVAIAGEASFVWADRPTALRPPVPDPDTHFVPGSTVEIHPQAEAFVATLAGRLARGVALFVDYGFPEAEYYHPQRHEGTLMCHQGHRADADPLVDVGQKDITAHVNFSAIALAGQAAGLEVLGYGSQGRFLLEAGLLEHLRDAGVAERANAQKLVTEHEMGELFKVLAFGRGVPEGWTLSGLARGDRSHTL